MSKLKNSYVLLLHLQDTCVNKMSVIDVSNGDSYYQAKRASEVYFDTYIHTIKFPPMADDFQKMAQAGAGILEVVFSSNKRSNEKVLALYLGASDLVYTPPAGEGWVLTNPSTGRYYRQLSENTFEFRENWFGRGRLEYKQHIVELDLSSDHHRILSAYGFDSMDHLKRECPDEWMYVLAEMIFETLPKYD